MGVAETVDPLSKLSLPPGFRFNPTDEELMVNYLCPKVAGETSSFILIGDVDLYKHDPWVLPGKISSSFLHSNFQCLRFILNYLSVTLNFGASNYRL